MRKTGKLELTWVGKNEEKRIEPRILVEDKNKSNIQHDVETENMLIHGDNLIALKALEQDYAGKIKCIYIDPPYNTGNAFEHYDDGVEHSIWLSLMKPRLEILRRLLTEDGIIFVQIDDNEQAYLKVLMDEIFGRSNFLNMITVKMKNIAGASGGGEDKRLKKNVEYILTYTKINEKFNWVSNAYSYTEIFDLVESYKSEGISWKYTSIMYDAGEKEYFCSTVDGSGAEIKIYKRKNPIFLSISQVAKKEGITEKEVYYKYIDFIHTTAMPQSSIRPRVMEKLDELGYINEELISIEYVPISGKNKGELYEQFYKGNKYRLVTWLKDVVEIRNNEVVKKDLQGTYWDGINLNNLTKEGNVTFANGKKPEALISRIINMTTEEGDYVLDSFLGSGTTAAVAHKMKRKWIGIEMGQQAYDIAKIRLDRVIEGVDEGGITKESQWNGGGGYRFYELAPSLLEKHPILPIYQVNNDYTFEMLCEAICKLEGFKYEPIGEMHGKSSETRYIHISKDYISGEYIQNIVKELDENHSVLIYGTKIQSDLKLSDNIEVKRIPKDLLKKYDFESEVR